MKKNKILAFVILCLVVSSCGKWLDVIPSDQIKEKELYSTAEGFHNQINGIYSVLSDASMYGRELSFGFVDALAQMYQVDSYSANKSYIYKSAAEFDYEYSQTKSLIEDVWDKSFNAITNCNSVILYAETADPEMFFQKEHERKCILGEAYALRALLHFDLMRLYAPAPNVSSVGKYLPYVKVFGDKIPMKVEAKEYMQNIISDLEIAHDLTMSLDTLNNGEKISDIRSRLEMAGKASQGRFTEFRGYRLHHYAVKALLARVHLYVGNQVEALKYAKELITLHVDKSWFRYTTSTYQIGDGGNRKMYGDIIFTLANNKQTNRFLETNDRIDDSYEASYLALQDYEGIFGDDVSKDYRARYQYIDNNGDKIPVKYQMTTGDYSAHSNRMIPILRMSEMYYIAAECTYDVDKEQAIKYLQYVRGRRGVSLGLSNPATKTEFIEQILNEVRRELSGEGQLWFFYKRLNLPVITIGSTRVNPMAKFVLPIPDSNNVI